MNLTASLSLLVTVIFFGASVSQAVRADDTTSCGWFGPVPDSSNQLPSFSLSPPQVQELDTLLSGQVQSKNLPSLAVSLFVGGRPVYTFGGSASSFSAGNVTANSLFRVGSLTKIMTTLLSLKLVDVGQVDFDRSILEYEPLFQIDATTANWNNHSITPRQLSSHLAGLPREAPCSTVPDSYGIECNFNSSQIYSRLASEMMILQTNTLPSYSNLGFSVLGNGMGKMVFPPSTTSPETSDCQNHSRDTCAYVLAVRKLILQPLDLEDSIGFWSTDPLARNLLKGHADGIPLPFSDLGWSSPSGQMFTSPNSMNTLIARALGWQEPQYSLLSSTIISEWLMQRYVNGNGVSGYACPWQFHLSNTSPAYWLRYLSYCSSL